MTIHSDLKERATLLPENPGVYLYIDADDKIIYVGKARNLRKRVISYFGKNQVGKTRVMVSKIREIRHIVVDSESEALLLENNLIKQHQPRYNVLMKDDKTFPWICIKNEHFPRVFLTRNVIRDGSLYFGPYTSVVMARTLLALIRQLYTLRTCTYNLAPDKIATGKYRVCLEFHVGNCLGPCTGLQKEEDYRLSVDQVKEILKGNIHNVTRYLKEMMAKLAAALRFEEAQAIKLKLEILEKYQSRSTVVSPKIGDVDVIGYTEEGDLLFVNYMRVVKGAIVQTYTLELRRRIEDSLDDLIALAITELRQRHQSVSKELIVPFVPDLQEDNLKYTVPRKGDKLKLLELAGRNAIYHKLNLRKRAAEHKPADRTGQALERMRKDLHLPELPLHIECFDNSNIQGYEPVAACVVFRKGKPSKKDYRHFNIKTVSGPDDYSSMQEVVFRRYRRMLDEAVPLPQLVIIDGGKGQLSSAMKSIESLGLRGRIGVIGIAKKLEEIYFPGDSVPIYLDKNSVTLKIIQNLRNEAHRFGISFHRDRRSRSMTISEIDEIPGIGPKTKEILLKKFGTPEKIKGLSLQQLTEAIGRAKASKVAMFYEIGS